MLSGLLITLDVLVCMALVGVVLLQRSEGGAFGVGGGPTGLITTRGAGDLLTRTTWVLFTLFVVLSLGLTLLGAHDRGASSVVEKLKLQSLDTNAMTSPKLLSAPLPSAPLPGEPQNPSTAFGGGAPPSAPPAFVPTPSAPTTPVAQAAKTAPAKTASTTKAAKAAAAKAGQPVQDLKPLNLAPVPTSKSDAPPTITPPPPAASDTKSDAPKSDSGAPASGGAP
jgi:preprotein translocase subunit SecG